MKPAADYTRIEHCRACNSISLSPVVNLGVLAYNSACPKAGTVLDRFPVMLCRCGRCGLLQLEHDYDPKELFGVAYTYRSGSDETMRNHLESIIQDLVERFPLRKGSTVVDIGANDGTLLKALPKGLKLVAVEPGMKKYSRDYADGLPGAESLTFVPHYFPSDSLPEFEQKVRLVTSIAVLGSVTQPKTFMRAVHELLDRDGIWYCEQPYAGALIENCAYDMIGHETVCYFGLRQLLDIAALSGLKIIDVSFNAMNGGSIGLVFARSESAYSEAQELDFLLAREARICSEDAISHFNFAVQQHATSLHKLLFSFVVEKRKKICAAGLSIGGNVVLQRASLSALVRAVADDDPERVGKVTPGTGIPIVPESSLKLLNPDYLLILSRLPPEVFTEHFQWYTRIGGRLVFPFSKIEVYPI